MVDKRRLKKLGFSKKKKYTSIKDRLQQKGKKKFNERNLTENNKKDFVESKQKLID